jgi:hypothetical protein
MSFVPVRFEPLMKSTGYVSEITDETVNVVVRCIFPEEDPPPEWYMDLIKEKLPSEEVAKCQAGTYIDYEVGYHYDRFGTCRRGHEFRADVAGTWTPEDIQGARLQADELAHQLGWATED